MQAYQILASRIKQYTGIPVACPHVDKWLASPASNCDFAILDPINSWIFELDH